ncbi:MAG: tRNA/tmRNA/rRNA uracil-C5-methylase (TrmA/RlmC/RlmD family), partial [Candidatus Omnitrophota bacterium]
LSGVIFDDVVPSPQPYNYRHRLDLKLKRTKEGVVFIGFTAKKGRGVIPIEDCPIGMQAVSDFIPQLKKEAIEALTPKYRQANLVVRTGDDGRVFWGGIGKRSLRMNESDYLWTEIRERKIYYAMETFFQANLSILPLLFDAIDALNIFNKETTFYDLYGGVGFFGLGLIDSVRDVVHIENAKASVELARYNVKKHALENFQVIEGDVEEELPPILKAVGSGRKIAMIDPPRAGLSDQSRDFITNLSEFEYILYLSCNPEALARDLNDFIKKDWNVERIIPFDFFPKTKHLETLVIMHRGE